MYAIPNGFRNRATSLHISKFVDKKEILHTLSNTSMYFSSDKVGTVGHGVLIV
jgi:non-homologous end joining protein Ku